MMNEFSFDFDFEVDEPSSETGNKTTDHSVESSSVAKFKDFLDKERGTGKDPLPTSRWEACLSTMKSPPKYPSRTCSLFWLLAYVCASPAWPLPKTSTKSTK